MDGPNNAIGRLAKTKSTSASFRLRSSPSLNSLRLRRIFDMFDKNGDGIITMDELSRALGLLGLDTDLSDLQSTLSSFIRPENQGLLFEDFEVLHRSIDDSLFLPPSAEEPIDEGEEETDLSEAFKVFDEDGDGFISAKELQVVLSKLGLPEAREMDRVQQMIHSVDTNRDGRVDFTEFKTMMRSSVLVAPSY